MFKNTLLSILQAVRVKSYVKNFFVFAALVFSGNLLEPAALVNSILMFCSFCFMSSAVYLMNDMSDKDKDKIHPVKKERPIASGAISMRFAKCLFILFFGSSLLIVTHLPEWCLYALLFYFVNNILYTFYTKRIVLFDVYSIALGFVIRVVSGALAIQIEASNYLLMTTLFVSVFLGFAKRYSEVSNVQQYDGCTRDSLKDYSLVFLRNVLWALVSITCLFYSFWTMDIVVIERVGTNSLILTTPLVIFGFFEYMLILSKGEEGDPVTVLYKQKRLIAILILYVISILYILY